MFADSCGSDEHLHREFSASCFDADYYEALLAEEEAGDSTSLAGTAAESEEHSGYTFHQLIF
ncbi:hypothetical protein [Alteribacter aurantiacus]|uniref:hypothetical protein n=1 Tax=Alteribacter aurantiacus TaxID=254410 RepID=UPI00047D9D79|nr:hypothetical protein [Alteribacter aurantiacus]